MQTVYLTNEQVPAVIRRACPEYSGRKFKAEVSERITLTNGYWEGGSRSTYVAVNLETGEVGEADQAIQNPFRCPQSPTVEILPGVAVIEHSISCGRDCGITIHLHPENVTQLLPAPEQSTWAERVVLSATRSLKSSYAGISDYRFHEAARCTGIGSLQWQAAKVQLIGKKLLNKAGAMTPAGRNAIGRTGLHELHAQKQIA